MEDEIEVEALADVEAEVAEEEEEQDFAESEDEEQEAEAEEDDSEEPEEEKPRKKKNGFQSRINELTREKYEQTYKAQALQDKVDFLMSQQQPQVSQTVEEVREPQPEDYETNADFIRAQARWEVEQEFVKKDAERSKKAKEEEEAKREKEEINTSYKQRAQEAVKRYPDFIETVQSAKIDVEQDSLELIMSSEFGPDIAYHLAKNPDDADKFSKLSAIGAAKMIGRLETRFDNKTPKKGKKLTKAPSPIKGIKTKTNVSSKDPSKMSMAEYTAWRNAKK